jgi:hypothetical protein
VSDGTGANESKNDPYVFSVGDLVKFTGYNYTPDFIMIDEKHEALGIVIDTYREGRHYMYNMYTVYWFKLGNISKVPSAHIKLVSL